MALSFSILDFWASLLWYDILCVNVARQKSAGWTWLAESNNRNQTCLSFHVDLFYPKMKKQTITGQKQYKIDCYELCSHTFFLRSHVQSDCKIMQVTTVNEEGLRSRLAASPRDLEKEETFRGLNEISFYKQTWRHMTLVWEQTKKYILTFEIHEIASCIQQEASTDGTRLWKFAK